MRVLRLVEQVAKNAVEFLPLVIVHREKPIHYPERIVVILSCLVPHEFGCPPFEILTVEEADPLLLLLGNIASL